MNQFNKNVRVRNSSPHINHIFSISLKMFLMNYNYLSFCKLLPFCKWFWFRNLYTTKSICLVNHNDITYTQLNCTNENVSAQNKHTGFSRGRTVLASGS